MDIQSKTKYRLLLYLQSSCKQVKSTQFALNKFHLSDNVNAQ